MLSRQTCQIGINVARSEVRSPILLHVGPAATKYRKGACNNCGAMSHKTKDCMERPRKKGAKFTGQDIQPDELVQEFNLNFSAKRDRCMATALLN